MEEEIRLERCSGAALARYVPDLARLRITVFREFPYLYDGDMDYEQNYLRNYAQHPSAVIVIALAGDRVVGAATGMALRDECDEFKKPFVGSPFDIDKIFYCAESVLDAKWRGRGLGHRFFHEREAHAAELGGFTHFAFCAVDRPADHPRRPADYRPLDPFWQRRGYTRHPGLTTEFVWKDLDETAASPKQLTYWLKPA
ncbi:MAG: GNAT family N-acetyltransferase [Verrucomicrobiae bacterium]|nr:GNAT family N-acetyltransferase [Verrucomicrobiae bacterium]